MVLLRYNELTDFFQDSNGHNIAGDEINGIFLHKTSMQVISIEIMRSPVRIGDLHLPYHIGESSIVSQQRPDINHWTKEISNATLLGS